MKKRTLLPKSGVYLITNTVNNKVYIGKDKNLPRRWTNHRCDLRAQRHGNKHLQNAWNKYGEAVFTYEILGYCLPEDLVGLEQYWMEYYGYMDNKKCYNKKDAEDNIMSEETKIKISVGNKGKKITEESRARMSISHTGKPLSLEHCSKISVSHIGESNPFYGKEHSLETRAKMSAAQKGRPWTERQREAHTRKIHRHRLVSNELIT